MQRAVPSFPANQVGFQMGAELQAAAYKHNSKPITLIFISYPTNSIARARYAAIRKNLDVNQKVGAGAIYGKVEKSYILLAQGAQSKRVASDLMGRLSIVQQVSWDQPPPGKPVTVQMFHLLLGNIILVLIVAGMAVLSGVLVFVSRKAAARWFPDSDWARAYEDSIIRLNLK